MSVSPRNERLDLFFRMLPANTEAKAEDTLSFLKQLRHRYRGPLTIFWDRGQIHDKSKVVHAWLAKHPEVVTERFPGYAPELNPDEYVWTHTKYASLCNYCAPDLPSLGWRVEATLSELAVRPLYRVHVNVGGRLDQQRSHLVRAGLSSRPACG